MLVLSRHPQERIIITLPTGETITVMLVRLMGDKVRIGVEAPKHIKVLRKEVAEQKVTA